MVHPRGACLPSPAGRKLYFVILFYSILLWRFAGGLSHPRLAKNIVITDLLHDRVWSYSVQ